MTGTLTLGAATIHFDWPTERPHFAVVTEVHDGDTIKVNIDCDFSDWKHDFPLRLAGCNAWELKSGPPGLAARDNLKTLLPVGTQLVITSIKDYKYGGEYIAKVYLMDGTDLVAELIAQQWLAPWDGTGKGSDHVPPWPRTV